MAIHAITETTEIKEGQWICGTSKLAFGLCAEPRQIERIVSSRIYTVKKDEQDTSSFLLRKTAKFVCDTRAEGENLARISNETHEEISATVNAMFAANIARIPAIQGYAH